MYYVNSKISFFNSSAPPTKSKNADRIRERNYILLKLEQTVLVIEYGILSSSEI